MKAYTKEEMDAMATEAFATEEIEERIDLGFDPEGVVKGKAEDVAEFNRLHAAAQEAYRK